MLNPPLSEEELGGATLGHYPPEVQNGMVCGNKDNPGRVRVFK